MQFLTKSEIREKLEIFLEGYPNSERILCNEDWDKEFLHIGGSVQRITSKYQSFLLSKDDDESQYDKDVRQGSFKRMNR